MEVLYIWSVGFLFTLCVFGVDLIRTSDTRLKKLAVFGWTLMWPIILIGLIILGACLIVCRPKGW